LKKGLRGGKSILDILGEQGKIVHSGAKLLHIPFQRFHFLGNFPESINPLISLNSLKIKQYHSLNLQDMRIVE
jgi:hypothetical protein